MKYEVLLFDADDTLFDFKKSEREAFKNTMLEFRIHYDENHHLKIYHDINAYIWKEFEQGLITQENLKVERFRRFADKIDATFEENEFAQAYMKHLADASFLFEESLELLEYLHEKYKLAIVTNGLTAVQNKRLRKSIAAKFFETIVISEEIQLSKPDPRIFEYTTRVIDYSDKSKILMIGDSLTSDIQGGINFGVDTCWYNPNESVNHSLIKPTYQIASLTELKKML